MGKISTNLLALAAEKEAIRQAIVGKGVDLSVYDPLSAYPAAIGSIETGGGAVSDDVIIMDYDGTVLNTYSAEEFQALQAYPEPPVHEGLTFQEWNWPLADAKEHVAQHGDLVIGPTYITTDGKCHFHYVIGLATNAVGIGYENYSGRVVIDWGDGTVEETNNTRGQKTHTYQQTGEYVIKTYSNASDGQYSITYISSDQRNFVKEINLGSIYSLGTASTQTFQVQALEKLSIPKGLMDYSYMIFQDTLLKGIVFPSEEFMSCGAVPQSKILEYASIGKGTLLAPGVFTTCCSLKRPGSTYIYSGDAYFQNGYALEKLVLGESMQVPNYGLQYCVKLKNLVLPSGIMFVGQSAFESCLSLREVTIPAGVIQIGNRAFANTKNLKVTVLATVPPTLGGTAFNSAVNFSIYVPAASVETYKTATNWIAFANYIYPIPE